MPRRTTRSAHFPVKSEAVSTEEAENHAAPESAPICEEPKSSIRPPPARALRSGPRAAPVASSSSAAAAAAAAASASATANPVSMSRFFASQSSPATKGRKRKAPESGAGGAPVNAPRRAVHVKEEPRDQGEQARGGTGGRGGFTSSTSRASSALLIPPAAAIGAPRRSTRINAVKEEELLHLPETFPPPAGAAVPNGGVDAKHKTKKEHGAGKPKATNRFKAEGRKGGREGVEEKSVPPRLAEKAALIIQVMDKLYPNPPIPINHLDSFTLLCGVLLSAQTTDAQVNLVTKKLFKVAPNPILLSKMAHEDLQQIIRSVGLAPTKAKHLIALSRELLDRFDGQVPQTFDGLMSLPGVGRKTAAVVMVQAFNTPAFPVDTHIHRLALRWGLTKNEKNASKVEEDLMAVFPRESWAKLHLQFIYFGREHCQARVHEVSACPICCWVKKTGPSAPKALSELSCLRDYLASPTPPKKSSKNAIVYSERMLEMEQFKMKLEEAT